MLEAAHRVMVLVEAIDSEGKPTLEQVEAAILGDHGDAVRKLEEVFSEGEVDRLIGGGGQAVSQAEKIFSIAEHYRLELIRVMQFANRQMSDAHKQLVELTQQTKDLLQRIEVLETGVEEVKQLREELEERE